MGHTYRPRILAFELLHRDLFQHSSYSVECEFELLSGATSNFYNILSRDHDYGHFSTESVLAKLKNRKLIFYLIGMMLIDIYMNCSTIIR